MLPEAGGRIVTTKCEQFSAEAAITMVICGNAPPRPFRDQFLKLKSCLKMVMTSNLFGEETQS
jgi:hypothetical protein